jgi:hypothetical protein
MWGWIFVFYNNWVEVFENKKFKELPGFSCFSLKRVKESPQFQVLETQKRTIMRWVKVVRICDYSGIKFNFLTKTQIVQKCSFIRVFGRQLSKHI